VKAYIHARLAKEDRVLLEQLKEATGRSESEIVRRGLRLMAEREGRQLSALDLAGRRVGRFTKGPKDLSTNKRHLDGFGS
jgi:Arc/MetJ-type ribon-helix-helix transcriptional regulator